MSNARKSPTKITLNYIDTVSECVYNTHLTQCQRKQKQLRAPAAGRVKTDDNRHIYPERWSYEVYETRKFSLECFPDLHGLHGIR